MEPAPPETPRLSWPAEWRCPAISAALLLAAVLLIHPVVEMGMNDDWSYIHVARGLALQGRLIYHGWAEPTMIPQAFWGALFFKALGFSFTAARISTVVLALLLVPVLYALGREAGLKPAFANFATLVVILCPDRRWLPPVERHVSTYTLPDQSPASVLLNGVRVYNSKRHKRNLRHSKQQPRKPMKKLTA
jgi:hypothetical protein